MLRHYLESKWARYSLIAALLGTVALYAAFGGRGDLDGAVSDVTTERRDWTYPCAYYGDVDGLFHPSVPHPRFIVTGGAGFIGSHVVKQLARLHGLGQIKVVDNLWRGHLSNLQYDDTGKWAINLHSDFCQIDLRDPVLTAKYIRGADIIYHLADVVAGVGYVFSHQESVFRDNLLINTNTLRASKDNHINNYIYVGTACSFPKHLQMGPGIHALRENETYPAEPESSYGWSKLMGEYEAELNQNDGFRVGLLRLHNVYGPRSDYSPSSGQVIPSLIRKATNYPKEDFVVWGSGSQYRDFIFVDDVVNALLRMQELGMDQGVIQVGNAKAITISELATIITTKVGERTGVVPPISFDKTKPEGDRGRIAVNDRARDILHWHPSTNIESGIDKTMKWMKGRESKPQVLVILIGEARGSEYAWKSLYKHLLKPYNAHLATLFTESSPMTMLQEMAQFVWTVPEYQDWGVVFNLASAECNNQQHLRDWHVLFDIPNQWLGGVDGSRQPASAGILLAFRWLVQKHLIAHNLVDKYDYFILSRADFLYQCDHENPLNFNANTLNLPVGENWGGFSDRHLIAPKSLFMQAINMTSELVCRPFYWHNILKPIHEVNLEKTLATMWKELGLTVQEHARSMFTVKLPDDHTRWSKGHQHPILSKFDGLKVKYESELQATTCSNNLQEEMQQLKEYSVNY